MTPPRGKTLGSLSRETRSTIAWGLSPVGATSHTEEYQSKVSALRLQKTIFRRLRQAYGRRLRALEAPGSHATNI